VICNLCSFCILKNIAKRQKSTTYVHFSNYDLDITIVIDTFRVVTMTILSDAPCCVVTYDHNSDSSSFTLLDNIYFTGVAHDHHIMI